MNKTIYFPVIIAFVLQGCGTGPEMEESYTPEYFCFDGYRGIGVVSVPPAPGSYDIPVLSEPIEGADEIASLIAEISSGATRFSVEGGAITENALFEFTYEHLGLPVESFEGDWIKVRLGDDASGNHLSGWIRNSSTLLVEQWNSYLPSRATFLATCDKPVLYTSPGGEAFFPEVHYLFDDLNKTKRPDYRIEHLEVNGPWMKVQLVTPSDLCRDPSQEVVITEGWIPFLLDDKSPAVWFHTRGC